MAEQQQQEPSERRISTSAAIASGIAVTAIVVGGGTGIWAWNKLTSSEPPPAPAPQEAAPPATSGSPAAPAPEAVPESEAASSPAAPAAAPEPEPVAEAGAIAAAPQTYWLSTSGEAVDLVPEAVDVKAKADAEAALETALERLLAGPRDEAYTTEIPQGTRLRKVSVREDGVHVDLSNDFTTGGGTLSMTGRVAQVLHTATSLNPDAPVWLDVDGEPLEVLGGEGLILDRPLTRQGFANDFGL